MYKYSLVTLQDKTINKKKRIGKRIYIYIKKEKIHYIDRYPTSMDLSIGYILYLTTCIMYNGTISTINHKFKSKWRPRSVCNNISWIRLT